MTLGQRIKSLASFNSINIESIQITLEYDKTVIRAEGTETVGFIDDYSYTTSINTSGSVGIIILSIYATDNLVNGDGTIALIEFKAIGQLGYFSALTFSDAQINSVQVAAVNGYAEILLGSLVITGQDNSNIGGM